MSTPVVAGLIALMNDAFHKQTGRYLTLTDIFDMLTAIYGSKKTNDYGYGLMSWDVFEQWMQSQGYKV
jgi:subtilase family serine protease